MKRKLFRDHDVRAILDGTKTQFREVVKPRNSNCAVPWSWLEFNESTILGDLINFADNGYLHIATRPHPEDDQNDPAEWTRNRVYCNYQPGDVLWVAEKWRLGDIFDDTKLSEWNDPEDVLGEYVHYAADDEQPHFVGQYRPSTQMPQWASRLKLIVKSVRVERVQAISEADAIAEGFSSNGFAQRRVKTFFGRQWNKDHPGSWDSNDWVWCVTFEVQA